MSSFATVTAYPLTCVVVQQENIALILEMMKEAVGMARMKLINEYRMRAQIYNDTVEFKAYDVNFTH